MRQQVYRTLTAKLQRRLRASSKPQVENPALTFPYFYGHSVKAN
jgi:hypothetical protein